MMRDIFKQKSVRIFYVFAYVEPVFSLIMGIAYLRTYIVFVHVCILVTPYSISQRNVTRYVEVNILYHF